MAEQDTHLTPAGKFISIVLVLALVAGGAYIVLSKYGGLGALTGKKPAPTAVQAPAVEATDTANITTVKEYKYIPADVLPKVSGVSGYQWDEKNKILRFSYNVWAGWLPVIAANHGTKPNADSVFSRKYGFQVEMVLMDDPVLARDAFAAGKVHTLWGTLDMMVLFAPELLRDSRTAPRIVQQIDWSNGGDGIVVRSNIKSVRDLRGKTITYALNSPSEYYITSLLLSAGMQPTDIKPRHTATAFEAAAAFVSDRQVDGCVSWAPDIYKIPEKVAGTRILSSTSDASKLIADVYAVRADFAKDHPDVVAGLVAGIFEGMDMLKAKPEPAFAWMAEAFNMSAEEVASMRNDAHATNFPENVQFFLNSANPTNLERSWRSASQVYQQLGRIKVAVPFDQVMDFSYIRQLQQQNAFPDQKDESVVTFTPSSYKSVKAEAPILTQTIRINFYPNSDNPFEPARDEQGNLVAGKLYDPSATATLEQVARLSGQFGRAVILIEGHTDASMRGRVPVQAVKDLSLARAEAIKRALIDRFKFDPNKFVIEGQGWERPADPNDPNNHAMNRRVEISVYPPEQQ